MVRLWLGLTLFCGALAGLNLNDAAVTVVSTATGSCIRFYSHDGHVGCATPWPTSRKGWDDGTTPQDGVDAEIFGITSPAHLDTFRSAAAASGARALVMDIGQLTKASMAQLVATKRVAGLLLLQTTTPPKAWSPGGAANSFNPAGFNALSQDFGFPISLVDQTQSATMLRYAEGNRAAAASTTLLPVYKAKLSWFMGPEAADVRVCLQWRTLTNTNEPKCVPVGGESVWSMITPPGPPGAAENKTNVVMATAQMDARSLFYSLAPGANTAASGAVALLGAARALKGIAMTAGMHGIAFALFQGEAWNAIGSTTFVDDVLNFKCETPAKDRNGADICLKPAMGSLAFRKLKTTLKEVVAVDQVGKKGSSLYLHCATQPCALPAGVSGVSLATGTKGLPTTTATAFGAMGTGVNRYVLGGYDTDFAEQNPYFSGHLDQVAAVSTVAITAASTKLAQTLWSLAGGASKTLIVANETVIAELFECVTQNWACPLWQEFAKPLQKAMEQQASEPGWTNTFPPRPSPQINGKERKPPATSLDLYTGTVWGSSAFGSGQSLGTRLPYIFKYCSSRKDEASCTLGGTNGCRWRVNPTDATKSACVRSGTLNYMSDNSSWNPAKDAVAVWPNLYELSAFGFFADTAGAALGTAQNGTYYHTAVSRALIQPQYESGAGSSQKGTQFDVNASASSKTLKLLFAEPYWQPPSTTVYADAGDGVAYAALAVGLVVAVAGFFCAKRTSQFLTKEKLL